jgi:hypothetical protein
LEGTVLEIIKSLKNRCGFETKGMKALGYFLKPFFGCTCDVPDYIRELNEPVIFVCNHYELFGPAAVALSLPVKFRPWTNSIVVNATESVEKMIVGFQHTFPFLSENGARKALTALAPKLERVMGHFSPIAVYHDSLAKQMRAIDQSVDALLAGDNIVLFPETALPKYSKGRVTEFFRSFALIGEYYRRRTGGSAIFCPLYVDKKHRKLCFGQLVRYGQEKAVQECERIVHDTRSQILAMADQALGPLPALPAAGGQF